MDPPTQAASCWFPRRAERRPDLAVQRDEVIVPRLLPGTRPERATASSGRRAIPGNPASRPEPRPRHVVRGDQRALARDTSIPGLAGDPEGREPHDVGRPELQPPGRHEVGRAGGDGRRDGYVIAYWIGEPHVRRAELRLERAVHEADGGVETIDMGMDDTFDGRVLHVVEPVRLDHLEALLASVANRS